MNQKLYVVKINNTEGAHKRHWYTNKTGQLHVCMKSDKNAFVVFNPFKHGKSITEGLIPEQNAEVISEFEYQGERPCQ